MPYNIRNEGEIMRKVRIRVLIFSVLILFAIFGGLGYFFSFYTTTFVNTKIQEVHLHKAETYSEGLANVILGDYNVIADKVERYLAQNPVTDFLNVILYFEKDTFIKEEGYSVYSLTNDTLLTRFLEVKDPNRLKNNSIIITQRYNMIKNIGSLKNAYELYFSFQVEEDYLIFARDFSPILNRVISSETGYYYLITTAGEIVSEKIDPEEVSNTLFYYLINSLTDSGNVDFLKTEIQARSTGFHNMVFEGDNKSLFYTPLLKDVDIEDFKTEAYALVYVQTEDALLSESRNIFIFTFVFIMATFVISIISIIYVFMVINKRTFELTVASFSYAKAKSYLIAINKKGKITYKNRALRAKAKGIEQFKNITEFTKEYPNIFEIIKEGEPFLLSFRTLDEQDIYINFVAFKKKRGYELVGADVSEVQSELYDLRNLALFNSLTKLPNIDNLLRKIKELVKKETNGKHALLIFSVIQFRNINRIFGRMIGDQVIIKIKEVVSKVLTDNEALYHIDADNFAILKTNIDSTDIIETVKRIFKLFDNPLNVVSNMLSIKIKAGIYNFETAELGRSDFASYAIGNAQLALRKAKESRQLNFTTFDISIGQVLNREMVMGNDLKEALNLHEMVMFFQPQFDLIKKRIFGFEALMKWTNPKYMNESAEKFIRMAEHNGLIIPLGKFAVEEAFRVAKKYENEEIKISLNISPVQILQSGFIRDLETTAKKIEVNPKQISLEITETFMIESFNEIIDKLKLLRDLGFSVHLDDFGTGFSSLLYLKELPISTLKIDKEFIKPIVYDEYSRSIVKHVVDLAKSLNLHVIAEGVETEEQKQIILKGGCTRIQGYLISKAVPEEQMEDLLNKYNRK